MLTAIKNLLASRKFVLALLGLISMGIAKLGLNWSAEAMALVVLPFLATILGVAYEDGQAKSAGAGTLTTQKATAAGAVTTIEPTGKQ